LSTGRTRSRRSCFRQVTRTWTRPSARLGEVLGRGLSWRPRRCERKPLRARRAEGAPASSLADEANTAAARRSATMTAHRIGPKGPLFTPERSFAVRPVCSMCGRRRVGKDCLDADAKLVGAAMCSTYLRGAHDRWPSCLPRTGPDQKHAFQDALAQVGCPASRFDRLSHDRPLALSNLATASVRSANYAACMMTGSR
jgi:hypothetical protein